MKLLIDTNILGKICYPTASSNSSTADTFENLLSLGKYQFIIPEIADYELRRKFWHMQYSKDSGKNEFGKKNLKRLDDLISLLTYLPLTTEIMKLAAEMWGKSRANGILTSSDKNIDGDVILAAQALYYRAAVLTENHKHLSHFVATKSLGSL